METGDSVMKVWVVTVTDSDGLVFVSVARTRLAAASRIINDFEELPSGIETWDQVEEEWSAVYPDLDLRIRHETVEEE